MSDRHEAPAAPADGASLAIAATVAAVLLWGLAPVGTRFIVERIDPLAVLALRFAISAVAFLPVLIHSRLMGWTRADLKLGIACALVGIVGYGLSATIGQQWTTASMAGLILASEPIWILLIWTLLERRRPGLGAGLGALLGLVGVGLLFGGSERIAGANGTLGAALVLVSAIAWSAYCVLVRDLAFRRGAVQVTAFTIVAGALPFMAMGAPAAARVVGHLTPREWAVLVALAIGGSVFAIMLWNYGVSRLSAPRAGPFLYLVPLITVIGGVGLLGEALDLRLLLGGAIILAGVVTAQGNWAERLARRLASRPQGRGRSSR